MELQVLKQTETSLEFKVIGETHTFLVLLKERLQENPHVKFVAYRIPHPMLEHPIFVLTVEKGYRPTDILAEAINEIKTQIKEFSNTFSKAMETS